MTVASDSSPGLRLFEGYGIEIELMIVDAETLAVRPVADRVMEALAGHPANEVELGRLACSNELVLHVVELKTSGPAPSLEGLGVAFTEEARRIDELLRPLGARLMPSAMHPFMNPATDTRLWPHEQNDIYRTFDRIFGCNGHGWSNLQSLHINLPFSGDDEFGRLHAAIRLVLPLLPALAASSPVVEGAPTGRLDSRLDFYRHNAKRIPSVAGRVVPEPVFTRADYDERILRVIERDLEGLDPDDVLEAEWVNSRGAIARWVRDSIEIRVLDAQETPAADLAVAALTVGAVRALVEERWIDASEQREWEVEPLAAVFVDAVDRGRLATIPPDYAAVFGLPARETDAGTVLRRLVEELVPSESEWRSALDTIVEHGCLAERILRALGDAPEAGAIREVYGELCECLLAGQLFEV